MAILRGRLLLHKDSPGFRRTSGVDGPIWLKKTAPRSRIIIMAIIVIYIPFVIVDAPNPQRPARVYLAIYPRPESSTKEKVGEVPNVQSYPRKRKKNHTS